MSGNLLAPPSAVDYDDIDRVNANPDYHTFGIWDGFTVYSDSIELGGRSGDIGWTYDPMEGIRNPQGSGKDTWEWGNDVPAIKQISSKIISPSFWGTFLGKYWWIFLVMFGVIFSGFFFRRRK